MNTTTTQNYFGKQHSKSSYIKEFSNSVNQNISYFVYKFINGIKYTTPADSSTDLYIPNNLVVEGNLIVNGKKIRISTERDPKALAWGDVGADYILESTGFFLTDETARCHIEAGAKRVVMSAPSKDETPMFVMGVNHESYANQDIV